MSSLKTLIPVTACLLLLLAGCSKEAGWDTGGGLPMRVVPTVAGDTKASMRTEDLQAFYLQVGSSASQGLLYFGPVSKGSGGWSASKPLFWEDENSDVYYAAVCFGSHAFRAEDFGFDGVDLTLPTDQSTQAGLNGADLLTQKNTTIRYSTAGGVLPVELGHGLTKVNFELTLGASFYDALIGIAGNPVTVFTVSGSNTEFRFYPFAGTCDATAGTEADITPLAGAYTPGTASDKRAKAVYEAILVPQDIASGQMKVSFRIGTAEYEWTNASALTLAAGQTVTLPLSATAVRPLPTVNGHAYVDLGLPSGLKWATCNVGGTNPEDYGDYFAWGETEPYYEAGHAYDNPCSHWKSGKGAGYAWSSYKWCNGSYKRLTKYNTNSSYGTVDNKTVLEPEDDAASKNCGDSWRMPTDAEWTELRENCTWTWTTLNNVRGRMVTGPNGGSIFLPAAGYRSDTSFNSAGSYGYYWSSSLNTGYPYGAWSVDCGSYNVIRYGYYRNNGLSVRPVTK